MTEAAPTIPDRRPFTVQYPARTRSVRVVAGALAGLAAGTLLDGTVATGAGWTAAAALAGLLAGVAASWSP